MPEEWKDNGKLPLLAHWLILSHMTTSNCKSCWREGKKKLASSNLSESLQLTQIGGNKNGGLIKSDLKGKTECISST